MSLTERAFFTELLSGLVLNPQRLRRGVFCRPCGAAAGGGPRFPRLEVVLRGEYATDAGAAPAQRFQQGDMLFIPAERRPAPLWPGETLLLSVLFAPSWLGFTFIDKRAAEADFRRRRTLEIPLRDAGELDYILQALNHLAVKAQEGDTARYLLLSLLHIGHGQLLVPLADNTPRSRFIYKSICTYLQDNFTRPLNREGVAAMFNITPNHLSRIFRREGSMSFVDYLQWVRLGKAKLLLQQYHLTVNEIALRCGYADANYFCRLFKHTFAMTPTEYRNNFS
ncbi:helix-turn-helix transcriptional regulator [Sodalis sp. RH21]|uniref:AraC family transcriptional regulator n=1 Tax=unclassified Sodalis (in: enterobacteria) TaxID=2636512 RepID=UPI0039B374A9